MLPFPIVAVVNPLLPSGVRVISLPSTSHVPSVGLVTVPSRPSPFT